jgi:membrane protein YdbS with pleckstrin-like domain
MNDDDLLKNEKVEKILSPHPLSFMKYQSLCLFLLIWGIVAFWIIDFSQFSDMLGSNEWYPVILWGVILCLAGVVAALITVRWLIFGLYAAIFFAGAGMIIWQNWLSTASIFILVYTIAVAILGFLMVELYRRSHKYIISNQRIVFKGGIVTKEERTLRYDKISDVNSKQGVLGQIIGFGTIIPISQSGFGLGADKTFAAGGVQLGEKKAKLFGFAGGEKEVQTPRARSYFELHGVYPYKEVKKLVEQMVQGSVITPYQQEQVSFQKEQVDIQKQMRDLLKMQSDEKEEEKIPEEKNDEKKIPEE